MCSNFETALLARLHAAQFFSECLPLRLFCSDATVCHSCRHYVDDFTTTVILLKKVILNEEYVEFILTFRSVVYESCS